jgi:hypothetical protein
MEFTYYVIQVFKRFELCVAGFTIVQNAEAFAAEHSGDPEYPVYIIAVNDKFNH